MKRMLVATLLLSGMTWLVAQPAPVFAQGVWQVVNAKTDAGSPSTPTSESGTATAHNSGQLGVAGGGGSSTFGSKSSASATASADGSGTNNTNNRPTAEGK